VLTAGAQLVSKRTVPNFSPGCPAACWSCGSCAKEKAAKTADTPATITVRNMFLSSPRRVGAADPLGIERKSSGRI
jgi:hypothetical protein